MASIASIIVIPLVPLLVIAAGGLLIRGQGSVRGVRFWVGIALMLGPIAFLYLSFDRRSWWSALLLLLLIALLAVLAIPSLRSQRWLVWPVVGGVLFLSATQVIASFWYGALLWARLSGPIATASVVGVVVEADGFADPVVVEDEAGQREELALGGWQFVVRAPWPVGHPEPGDLLLAARFENETWFVIAGQTPACRYGVEFYWAWDLGDAIVSGDEDSGAEVRGIRLPKAAGYREQVPPGWDGLWAPYAQFCLNREGEVVSSSSVGVP